MYQMVRINLLSGARRLVARSDDSGLLLEMALTMPPRRTARRYVYTIIEPVN
jgi:hypothetical protein